MKTIVSAAVVLFFAVQAQAQTTPQGDSAKPARGAMFAKIDLDGDGRISKDEAAKSERKVLSERFDAIDTGNDGFLDKDELKAFREKMKAARNRR